MPDHPSWPAELVEKAAVHFALAADPDADWLLHWGDKSRERFREHARRLLSALSGDLVPREEAISDAKAGWDTVHHLKAQADALAEALEGIVGDNDPPLPDFSCAGPSSPSKRCVRMIREEAIIDSARFCLASYRKTASGETEG